MFAVKQIVWAKTKGYPWWPAEINKLPTSEQNYFKVTFVGQTNHALLEEKAIRKYQDHYDTLKNNNYKGLQNSIDLANNQIQKRKTILTQNQAKVKLIKNGTEKCKKIRKNNKKKLKAKKKFLSQIKPLNDQMKTFREDQKKKNSEEVEPQILPISKQGQAKSQIQSEYLSVQQRSQEIQVNELEYIRNVDRKKIEKTEEELFSFITRFNSNLYEKERECFETIEKIQKEEFKSEQLLQSKITNMITYIHKKLSERHGSLLKKDEIQRISKINNHLKEKVVDYLFDCCYYDQYLKRMEKNILQNHNAQKEEKEKNHFSTHAKKHRKYKRRTLTKQRSL